MTARTFVHVFATFGKGGPQVRAVQLFRRLGGDVRHVVMAMDGCTDAAADVPRDVAVEVVTPPARSGVLANVRRAARWLAVARPSLVLTYNWGAIESAWAARRLGLPLVHHEDGFGPEETARRLARRSWLRRWVLRPVPVAVPSAVLARIAIDEWRLPPAHVHHLPNGVDLQRFRPGRRAGPGPVIGVVGGLRREKDHANLLRAFARLDHPARLCVVGGGALDAELRALAAELGVGARVEFTGPAADPAPHYAGFDVFALPSRTEQMPLVLLEAMACGLPVVATDVGDVRTILPDEAACCVVPPGDPAALAAALRRVVSDPQLAAALGAANRRRVEARYEAGACLDRFLQLYDRTARGRH